MSSTQLIDFFKGIGEKPFRAVQVLKWIHQYGVEDFALMSNISKALRTKLSQIAIIRAPRIIRQWDSMDGTRKFLIAIAGGNAVETVFIPDRDRGTLCVSSQAGCSPSRMGRLGAILMQ